MSEVKSYRIVSDNGAYLEVFIKNNRLCIVDGCRMEIYTYDKQYPMEVTNEIKSND